MAAPTNTSAATAIDITSLPYAVTQNVHDSGTTFTVWYKATAAADGVWGLWGFGDLITYRPTTTVYITDPAGAAYQTYQNRPTYFEVTAGLTYYFKFAPNAGNPSPASLQVSLLLHTEQQAPAGSIGVVDTQNTYPIALLDRDANYSVLQYIRDVRNGAYGAATLSNGLTLLGGGAFGMLLYDGNWTQIANPSPARTCYWITSNDTDTFYASTGWPFSVGVATVYKIDSSGNVDTTTWTLDQVDVRGLAVSPDESILYYIASFDTDTNKPVRRWDLINDVVLSDLAAGIDANTYFTSNLLCFSDGSVFVGYRNDTSHTQFVRQYSAAGAVIRTFTLTWSATTGDQDLLAHDVDETTFWYWQHGDGSSNATSTFTQFLVADGSVVRTVLGAAFDAGRYAYSETATPLARFGMSYSCPFWITRSSAPAPPPDADLNGPGGLAILRAQGRLTEHPIRRVRIAPAVFETDQRIFHRRFELFTENGNGTVTGQGDDPTIELHVSNDNGYTYPIQRTLTTGRLGDYSHRAYANQLGHSRRRVYKCIQTDPVRSVWIGASIDIEEGLN